MNTTQLLEDKSIKATQKRDQISDAIENRIITVSEIKIYTIDDKGAGIILEAMEAVSRKRGSAYALGRIILIPEYANSKLFDMLTALAEQETENGVKNQYLAGLKKAKKLLK